MALGCGQENVRIARTYIKKMPGAKAFVPGKVGKSEKSRTDAL